MTDIGPVEVLALVGGLAILLTVFYVLQIANRMKTELLFRLRRAAVGLSLLFLGFFMLPRFGYSGWEVLSFSSLLALTPMAFMKAPKRSRHVPTSVKRAVVARDLRGQELESANYHLHHVVPFAKGGDHSTHNLKVIPKDENLRLGARMPGLLQLVSRSHWGSLLKIVILAGSVAFIWHHSSKVQPSSVNEVRKVAEEGPPDQAPAIIEEPPPEKTPLEAAPSPNDASPAADASDQEAANGRPILSSPGGTDSRPKHGRRLRMRHRLGNPRKPLGRRSGHTKQVSCSQQSKGAGPRMG